MFSMPYTCGELSGPLFLGRTFLVRSSLIETFLVALKTFFCQAAGNEEDMTSVLELLS